MNKRVNEVKYLPNELKALYEYDLKRCRIIEGLTYPLINIEDVLQAHYILAHYFTDESAKNSEIESMLVGLKSENLLASALGRQIVSYGSTNKYSDPIDICSTLFYGLVKDHAFHDGNKRTALLVLLSQLENYGYYPNDIYAFEKLVVSIAEGSLAQKFNHEWKKFKKLDDSDIKCISYILKRKTDKIDHSFHMNINMREFCDALKYHGVEYSLDNMKVKFSRTIKKFGFSINKLTYTINFYGWTRSVQAKMARDTFNALKLTDEFVSLSSIIDKEKSLYEIIDMFEVPFRRLKDK